MEKEELEKLLDKLMYQFRTLEMHKQKLKKQIKIELNIIFALLILGIFCILLNKIISLILIFSAILFYFKYLIYNKKINSTEAEIGKIFLEIKKLKKKYEIKEEKIEFPINVDNSVINKIIKDHISNTKKECYELVAEKGLPTQFDSHIGGLPYMPKNEIWPTDNKGKEIPLLIQINFKDILLDDYPSKGIFQMFYNSYTNEKVIRFYEDIDENNHYIEKLPEFNNEEKWVINKPIKISYRKGFCIKPVNVFNTYNKKIFSISKDDYYDDHEKIIKYIDNEYSKFISRGNIGGLANCTSYTLNNNHKLVPDDNKEIFVFIDSNLSNEINMQDYSYIWTEISLEDLKNKKFDELQVKWDCN